jgi:hypothetical protein
MAQMAPDVWTGEFGAKQLGSVHDVHGPYDSATKVFSAAVTSFLTSRLLTPALTGTFFSPSSVKQDIRSSTDCENSSFLLQGTVNPADLSALQQCPQRLQSCLFDPVFHFSARHYQPLSSTFGIFFFHKY